MAKVSGCAIRLSGLGLVLEAWVAGQEIRGRIVGRRRTESIGGREKKNHYARQKHTGSEEERD